MNLNSIEKIQISKSQALYSIFLATITMLTALLFPTFFYETTDDPLYRLISVGDFNPFVGPDSHVNFTSYLYLEFLILFGKYFNFNYFWDLFNYLITYLCLAGIYYQLLYSRSKVIKLILLALALFHFPNYFLSFHLTKTSGLFLVLALIVLLRATTLKSIKIKQTLIFFLIIIFTVFVSSLTRLKAPLLYIPTIIFSSIPIILVVRNKLKITTKFLLLCVFLTLVSTFSVTLWNLNKSYYSKSKNWESFYSYNDDRYQLMEYNNFRDSKKYKNIFREEIGHKSTETKDTKMDKVLSIYKKQQLVFYGKNKLLEIYSKLSGIKEESISQNLKKEEIINLILSEKRKSLSDNKNLTKEYEKYSYFEFIDKEMKRAEFSLNDYIIMEHWYLFDTNVFTSEKLKSVVQELNIDEFSDQFVGRLFYSIKTFHESIGKQFGPHSKNLYLSIFIILLGILLSRFASNNKPFKFSIYLVFCLFSYCALIDNYVKALPNWIFFPTVSMILCCQIIHYTLIDKIEPEKVNKLQSFILLLLVVSSLQIYIFNHRISLERLENKKNILSNFNLNNDAFSNKIIVNVGAEIPASNWCLPFNSCDLRRKYLFTGLGWTAQMGHDILFYQNNNISNLALDIVNSEKFIVAIDLYPLLENRLIKYYKDHYSCNIYFQKYLFIQRTTKNLEKYKTFRIVSDTECKK